MQLMIYGSQMSYKPSIAKVIILQKLDTFFQNKKLIHFLIEKTMMTLIKVVKRLFIQ